MPKLPSQDRAARIQRFNATNLHDAQLTAVAVEQRQEAWTATVRLELLLVAGAHAEAWQPATLTFVDCDSIEMDVDFYSKHACGDAVASGHCAFDAERIGQLKEGDPVRARVQELDEFLLFTITLCPVSGSLRVLARDFSLVRR